MALFFTGFGAKTVGVQPSGWTKRWHGTSVFLTQSHAGAIAGGKVMEETTDASGSFRTLISNDAVDSDTSPNQEVLFRASSTSNTLLQISQFRYQRHPTP